MDGHADALAATHCDPARLQRGSASWIVRVCGQEGLTTTNTAHHRVYGATRVRCGLGAQLAVCARAKAVEALKAVNAKYREQPTCPQFGPRGSVRSEARTDRLLRLDRVALHSGAGRVVCRLVLGARQQAMRVDPAWEGGGADLVWRAGGYYLHVTQSQDAPPLDEPVGGTLGVALGIVPLATESAGEPVTGGPVPTVRARSHLRRQRLQQVGTQNAKRRLRQLRRRAARFPQETNHRISTRLVHKAAVARKASALEHLSGIRERTTVRRARRDARHCGAFFPLRQYLADKAAQAGVPVYRVDPRTTSRTCSQCGYCEVASAAIASRPIGRLKPSSFASDGALLRPRTRTPRSPSGESSGPPSTGLWQQPARVSCKPLALARGSLTYV